MKYNPYDLIIAALLHDIGKVVQRAGQDLSLEKNPWLYRHAACTYRYLAEHRRKDGEPLWNDSAANDLTWILIAALAASHHKPKQFSKEALNHYKPEQFAGEKRLAELIHSADCISAGWDRHDKVDSPNDHFLKCPLHPIFDKVMPEKNKAFQKDKKLPLCSLSEFTKRLCDDGYTLPAYSVKDLLTDDYRKLLEAFTGDFVELQNGPGYRRLYVQALDSLLREYFWCVPSSTMEEYPAVSLYHHARTTATAAVALYQALWDDPAVDFRWKVLEWRTDRDFLLIGADVSGIQKYLYDLNPEHSRKAAKTLRARSFKIQALSWMAKYLLEQELDLTPANTLIDAGGKFLLLAPNSVRIKEKLPELQCTIERAYFEQYRGILSLNLDCSCEVSVQDLGMDKLRVTMEEVFGRLAEKKLTKAGSVLQADGSWDTSRFLFDGEKMYQSNLCQYCGKRGGEMRKNEDGPVCESCCSEIRLGKDLPNPKYYGVIGRGIEKPLITLGDIAFGFTDDSAPRPGEDLFRLRVEPRLPWIPLLATATHVPTWKEADECLIPHEEAEQTNGVLSFDKMALFSGEMAAEYLVALKGDVDNLGNIFLKGIREHEEQEKRLALSSYCALSDMMDLFFARFLPRLVEERFDKIYVVYTGGDDFALVGPWRPTVDFAGVLRERFSAFTGGNPDVHFSCGIVLTETREPVKQAFESADELLHKAKDQPGKNAVSLFGRTFPWDEFRPLMDKARQLIDWSGRDEEGKRSGMSAQLLYKLLEFSDRAWRIDHPAPNEGVQVDDLMYKSRLNYTLRDMAQSKNTTHQVIAKTVKGWADENKLPDLRVALTYAIYSQRKK